MRENPREFVCTNCGGSVPSSSRNCVYCGQQTEWLPAATNRLPGMPDTRFKSQLSGCRQPCGIIVVLWGAFVTIGGGVEISENQVLAGIIILASGISSIAAGGLIWPLNKFNSRPFSSIWLLLVGLVGFVAGVFLNSPS